MLNQLHHPNFFAVSITAIFAFVHNYDMQYILSLPSLCPPPFLIPTALLFLPSFLSFFPSPNCSSLPSTLSEGGLGAVFLPNDALLRGKKFDSWHPLLALSYSCACGRDGRGPAEDTAVSLFKYLFSFHNKYPDQLCFISMKAPLFTSSKYRFLSYCVHSVLTVTVR